MKSARWLTEQMVLAIHLRQLAEHGGATGIRDRGALLSALDRPRNKLAYEPETTDVYLLAGAYAFGIAMNHPFVDGNKRTAFMAAYTFLRLNGHRLIAAEVETVYVFLDLAAGQLMETELARWIKLNSVEATN